jgi:cobyrinic acid a,c-diamide synthase
VNINGATIRGHTYHHSLLSTELVSEISGQCPNGKSVSEAVYQQQRLTASYIHFYFYSNPHLIAAWLMP